MMTLWVVLIEKHISPLSVYMVWACVDHPLSACAIHVQESKLAPGVVHLTYEVSPELLGI